MRVRLIVLYAVCLIWLAGWRYYIIKDAAGPKEKLPPTLLLYPPLHTHNPKGDGICPERCWLKRPPVESGYFGCSRQLERFKFPTGAIGGFLCVNAVQSFWERKGNAEDNAQWSLNVMRFDGPSRKNKKIPTTGSDAWKPVWLTRALWVIGNNQLGAFPPPKNRTERHEHLLGFERRHVPIDTCWADPHTAIYFFLSYGYSSGEILQGIRIYLLLLFILKRRISWRQTAQKETNLFFFFSTSGKSVLISPWSIKVTFVLGFFFFREFRCEGGKAL